MAEKKGLPTEEEVEKMKPLKLAKLLEDLGMTEDETDEMEIEGARAELRKRIRDIQAAAATSRRPGQITEKLRKATSESKKKRARLAEICEKISKIVVSMDDDDKQKMTEFFGQDLQLVLEDVKTFLQNDDCPILVVGESCEGKSSLLNLLLGEDILSVWHQASTSALCNVRYGPVKKATVHLKGSNPEAGTRQHIIDLQDADKTKKEELKFYVQRWGREDEDEVEKVDIEWPLEFLKGGICLVDGPGIKTKKKMDEVVASALSSTYAFIYVINSANVLLPTPQSGGDEEDQQKDGLSILLELCQRQKWGNLLDMSQFDLESTMFVCNRWDCVPCNEEGEVKNDYLGLLKSHFPELRDDQVFFLSCIKAVGPAGQLSPEFSMLLDGLDKLLPQSLQHKLELQYHRVNLVLQKASQYIRLKLQNASRTQKERREAKEEAQKRIANFDNHAKEVLKSLDQILTTARKEAEEHLKTFLKDAALKERVYQKILSDFPEVDGSEIGSARLITAIVNEIESQLKNNPTASAFNQCIRDADIRLREDFQTRFGALMEEHINVIEDMLNTPHVPSSFEKLGKSLKRTFFKFAGAIFSAHLLAMLVDPTLEATILQPVDLTKKLIKIVFRPDNREEYIKSFINQVFDAMTKPTEINSAVTKHMKGPIQYLKACKDAIPELRRVDEQLIRAETRPEEEIKRIYEPMLDSVTQLAEGLCGFYTSDIKKHEFDLTIGKPSIWDLHKEGGQGRVYLAELSKDGGTFTAAVKILKQLPSGETMTNFVREEENLRKLKGQHVVKCFGTYRGENDATGNPCLGLVMEYCPKTLDEEMFGESKDTEKRENSPAWWDADPEKQASAFSYTKDKAVQMCEGLKHIHDAGYMHRDLKLINVLVSSEGVVKLADLGSSKAEKAYARTHDVGTRFYTAPEVLARKEYNRSADIYSLGLILLEMWYGRTMYCPKDSDYDSELKAALPLNIDKQLPLPSWDGRAPPIPEWWNLINDCLRRNPGLRPTAENCRDRIAGMSLPLAQAADGAQAYLIRCRESEVWRKLVMILDEDEIPGLGGEEEPQREQTQQPAASQGEEQQQAEEPLVRSPQETEENVAAQTESVVRDFLFQRYKREQAREAQVGECTPSMPELTPDINPLSRESEVGRKLAMIGDEIETRYESEFKAMIHEAFAGVARWAANWGRKQGRKWL